MRVLLGLGLVASLAGCSGKAPDGDSGATKMLAVEAPSAPTEAAPATAKTDLAPVQVSLPQLAYAYSLGFVLPGDRIATTQDSHRGLCDKLGPPRCQLIALQRGGGEDQSSEALLKLRVATADARAFQDRLTRLATDVGGRPIDTKVDAEDVSKSIVDTEARIRQRELLVARLTELLRTRSGKVSELLEAERSVAQAQEELDQARGWLVALRGRVAMSDFEIRYSAVAPATSPQSVGGQLGAAVQGSGAAFLIGLRALLTLAIYLIPWTLAALPLVLGMRMLARRRRTREQA